MKGTRYALSVSLALLGGGVACSPAPVGSDAPGGGAATGGSGGSDFLSDVHARCGANLTADECNAEQLPYEQTFCVWIDWVELQDADTCGLGEAHGVCSWDAGQDACGSVQDAVRGCSDDRFLVRRETDVGIEIGRAGGCNEGSSLRDGGEICSYDADLGEVTDPAAWNYPECACHCAAEFPTGE
jgi:hypothetical protein